MKEKKGRELHGFRKDHGRRKNKKLEGGLIGKKGG